MSGVKGMKRHGYSNSPTYASWHAMKTRCNNLNSPDYENYGKCGVTYIKEWEQFENFLADMGERPDGMTLDRHPDKNGNYCKKNCRWATITEQNNNRRTKNPIVGVVWHRCKKYHGGGRWVAYTRRVNGKRVILYKGPNIHLAFEAREFYNSFILGEE